MEIVIENGSVYSRTGNIRGSLTAFESAENALRNRNRRIKGRFDSVLRSTLATVVGGVLISGPVFAAEKTHLYIIPAQSLNNALVQFASDSNLELVYTADMVRGLKARSLSGQMTATRALDQLLQDSGYTYRFINTRTVTLVALAEPDNPILDKKSIKLTKMTVVGDPINADLKTYQASNSSSATKTDTPIREIPHSIQVITRAVMNDQQNVTVSESLRNISGVLPNNPLATPDFERTRIRGFPSEQLLDGFSQYYNPGDRESAVNVERIEVLKGPSALLYSGGYGSPPGGLINVISKRPQPLPFGEVGLKFGPHQFYQPFFDLNQPLSDHALFRLTGEYTNSRGFIDALETERYNINPALTITNNGTTTLTLQGKVSKWEQQDYQGLPAIGTVSGEFTIRPETFIGPKDIDPSRAEFSGVWGMLDHVFNDVWSLTFKARYTRSEFDQKAQLIFGADALQADQPFSLPSTWLLTNSELFQQQEEMSFSANAVAEFSVGPMENTVLFGADYSEIDDQGFIEFDPAAIGVVDLTEPKFPVPYAFPGSRINNLFITNTTYGGYVQLQSTLFERVHVLAGVRLGNVTIAHENRIPGFEFSVQTDKTKPLPRFGAVFDVTDEFSVFASYSEGMRGHLFNNFRTAPEPELSQQIEGGVKFDIAKQLTGQFAVYQIDRSNIVVTDNTTILRASIAAGEQRSRGVEVDSVWQPSDELSFLVAYAYTDAEFSNGRAGVPSGAPLPGVPEHSGRLWANYRFQETLFKGLNIGAGIYAQSGVYLSNAHLFRSDSYYNIDASIAYERDRFKLGVSIKNLTDEKYFERLEYFGSRVAPSQGISVFGTVSMHY